MVAKINDPVDQLSRIADKVKKQQDEQQHQQFFKEHWQGIVFLCGEYLLITPLSTILEISPCPKLIAIPDVKHWFRGVANLRGDILPITDLQSLLFQTKTEIKKNTPVLVIKHQGELMGILVNKIMGLHRISKGKPRPLSQKLSLELSGDDFRLASGYISEEIQHGEKAFPLFDFHKLIEDPIFCKI